MPFIINKLYHGSIIGSKRRGTFAEAVESATDMVANDYPKMDRDDISTNIRHHRGWVSHDTHLRVEINDVISLNNSGDPRDDLPQSEKRMWRTLVRIVEPLVNGKVGIVLPGYDVHLIILIPARTIPEDVLAFMETHEHLHCQCNIGAENHDDLRFSGWEIDNAGMEAEEESMFWNMASDFCNDNYSRPTRSDVVLICTAMTKGYIEGVKLAIEIGKLKERSSTDE